MPTESRLDVRSGDGTRLALWVDGEGPPLVLVHGSMQDHTANRSLVDALVPDFTTYALDRRGFGASGDADDWAIEREFEDVACVVDHIAGATRGPVAVWGHSFGASCAMGGATLSDRVSGLVLYEPSLGLRYPPGSLERIDAAVAAGDPERAAVEVLSGVLGMADAEIDALCATPRWTTILRTAHTIPREARAEQEWTYRGQLDSITVRTLMLTGADSPGDIKEAHEAAAAALGTPQVRVLDGHGHLAHRADPALVANAVREFLTPTR